MKYKIILKPGDVKEVSKGIFVKDKRVLIVKPAGNNEERYDIPGGKLKIGETKEAGLYRECLEEVGLKIKKAEFIGRNNEREKNYFLVSEWTGDIVLQEEELEKYRWVPISNVTEYYLTKTAYDGIKMFLDTIY